MNFGEPINLKSVASLGEHLYQEVASLHDEAMRLTTKALEAQHTNNDETARALFSQALEKERTAAAVLEPAVLVEPIRATLFRNVAELALKCEDPESAQKLMAEAMLGIPREISLMNFVKYLPLPPNLKAHRTPELKSGSRRNSSDPRTMC